MDLANTFAQSFTQKRSAIAGMRLRRMIDDAKKQRTKFERTWYDNNFFDDGYHFRFVSRKTNRIIDLTNSGSSMPNQMRAIPKASKQIRGMANLLTGTNPHPVVLPEKVLKANFISQDGVFDQAAYEAAKKNSAHVAKRTGHWLYNEFEECDLSTILVDMIIIAAKESVGWAKIVPDAIHEKIITTTQDAFDVYLKANVKDKEHSPFMANVYPQSIDEMKANELFDQEALSRITPDNKYASSEIKDAYERSKYGGIYSPSDANATLLNREGYIKEYLDEDNISTIANQQDGQLILNGRKRGDPVIRQVFEAGEVTLRDKYITLKKYPFVDFRFEPGSMYQVSQIERFIPSNKSLDAVVSRIEAILHTMVVGVWLKQKGQSFRITNQSGGQVVEYDGVAPQQAQSANIPSYVFNFIGLLNSFIEEQGLSTATLGKIPSGVKAFAAIESLKESELSNLSIPLKMLQKTVKEISELYLDYAHDYFVNPQTVYNTEQGEPDYFDIIGVNGIEQRKALKMEVPQEATPVSKDFRVRVEIENEAAFTEEGRKSQTLDLINALAPFLQGELLNPEVVKLLLKETLDRFKVGSIQDITEALDELETTGAIDQVDIEKIKVAMLEVMQDTVSARDQAQQNPEPQNSGVMLPS